MSSKKRDRGHDRIKVSVVWSQPDKSTLSNLANEGILKRVSEALPKKNDLGLQTDIRKDITETVLPSGAIVHKHVYRFKYKRPYRYTRQVNLWTIFTFGIQLKKFEEELGGELNFTVDVDMQDDRLPWVFDNGDRGSNAPLKIAMRPGCRTYLVEGVTPVHVPRNCDSFGKLLGLPPSEKRLATDFMIVGEPRTAWKLYKYYLQLKRDGKLDQGDLDNHRLSTAFPDLVRVFYRHNTLSPEWKLVDSDGPKMYGQFMDHIMTGTPLLGTKFKCPDFGLRYSILNVNQQEE